MRKRLDEWCERGALALVLGLLGFAILATGAVLPWQFAVLQMLAAAALLLWIPRFWLNPSYRVFWPPVCWAVVTFVGYAAIRYGTADLEFPARQEFLRVLVYAVVFFVTLNNLGGRGGAKLLLYSLIALGTAVALYGAYQYLTDSRLVWGYLRPESYGRRASGSYICPNHFAGLLGLLLPAALALTLAGRSGPVARILTGYASLTMVVGLAFSVSRSGWVAAALGTVGLLVFLLRHSAARWAVLAALLALAGVGGFALSRTDWGHRRLVELLESQVDSPAHPVVVRRNIWTSAFRLWQDHPWFGAGPGHFDFRYPAYRTRVIQARPGYVHNDYLNTLADHGLVGLLLVLTCVGLTYAGVARTLRYARRSTDSRRSGGSDRLALTLGPAAGIGVMLVHSLTDFNLQIPANAGVTVAFLAVLASQLRFTTDRYWRNPRRAGWLLATVAAGAGALLLGVQGVRRAREGAWLQQAADRNPGSAGSLRALERAVAIEPGNFETWHALGEAWRLRSWVGDKDYRREGAEALRCFEQGMVLNPYDPYNYLRQGMTLDWLGRHAEAAPYYDLALRRDPENYYLVAHKGWHFIQVGDDRQALHWFEKSLEIKPSYNGFAWRYVQVLKARLAAGVPAPDPHSP